MTARQRNKTKYRIEGILNPAANSSLHFSRYWLLSGTCLGKNTDSWFMTAHKNTKSSDSCSEHISVLPLTFCHRHYYFISQTQQSRQAQGYLMSPLGQEGRLMEGAVLSHFTLLRGHLWDSFMQGAVQYAACLHAEIIQTNQKPQSQLFSLLFDFSSDLRQLYNLSPNSLSWCHMCHTDDMKTEATLFHLESLLHNQFSQEAEGIHFFQGG